MPIISGAIGSAALAAGGSAAAGAAGGGLLSGLGGALIGGGASVLGGFMRNNASAEQAWQQMAMQDYWLRNRHRIEIGDLEAAGLNPILSVAHNPPVPAGARGEMGDPISQGVSSAIQYQAMHAEVEKRKAEIDLLGAEAALTRERQVGLARENRFGSQEEAFKMGMGDQARTYWQSKIESDMLGREFDTVRKQWESATSKEQYALAWLAQHLQRELGLGEQQLRATIREIIARGDAHKAAAFLDAQTGRLAQGVADVKTSFGNAPLWLREAVEIIGGGSSAFRRRR